MEHMLSTDDNPFNPWTEFEQWLTWDISNGYNSLSLLGRMVKTSDELPQEVQDQDGEAAILEIVADNFSGRHIMVPKPADVQSATD